MSIHGEFADSPEFCRLVGGREDVDLLRLGFELAGDAYPGLDPVPYLERVESFAARVRDRLSASARLTDVLGQINRVLFAEERFQGNGEAYYDARNSYLNEVLDRRLGIPISLSVLYLAVARAVGVEMAGVNLPGHFLVRAGQGSEVVFVDPFHRGRSLDASGCGRLVAEVTGQAVDLDQATLAPCPPAVLVARMLRNLKAVYLRDEDFPAALPVVRRLCALLPGEPLERRDLGVICLRLDRPGEAVDHLGHYLERRPEMDDADRVRQLFDDAWREIARRN